ncbi:MAG: GNAT family N-acetyltransferase [Ignavibacteriaceae bacterium]|nr:GNAT family N-acetyltransferase [Ignavibacteriaceae bacterium]
MEVIKYTPAWKEKWDKFVDESNNGTMFHKQAFFDYHTPGKFRFDHLMVIEKGNILAVLPGAIMRDGMFESPIGASYGSVVTRDIKFNVALELVDTLIEYGRKNGIKGYLLTSAPMVYEDEPNQNIDFALLWRGAKYDLHYISSAIKLDTKRDLIERFSPTIRRNVRGSLKNDDITVELNKRYDEFYPILVDNKARHNVKPTHSYEDLIKLDELMPENLKLFMVYYKGKPIAGSSLFICNRTITLCFYNMLYYEYEKLKPIQRVMYEVLKWSTDNGYKYLDIGVSQDTKAENPMTPSMTLIDFKEKFDARTIMRNTIRLMI